MLVWLILIVLLIGLLILPVGVDAAYDGAAFTLSAKAGPVKLQLLPKKEKPPKPEKEKEQEPKQKKDRPDKPQKPKRKLTPDDILELAKIALAALRRFRRHLSVDVFMLHVAAAAEDPYDAVVLFGWLNAGLSALSPLFHSVLKIREEDIRTRVDFEPGRTWAEARVAATLQIWEILYIGLCAGFAFLRWRRRRKKAAKEAAKIETKG